MGSETQHPHELYVIAAIRWYANAIENGAIEAYMGSVRNREEMEDILRSTLAAITRLASSQRSPDNCPWPCGPNICRPSC